jgi:hypothetical protein
MTNNGKDEEAKMTNNGIRAMQDRELQDAATGKQMREPTERELSTDELEHVSAGIGIFRATPDKREAHNENIG